MSNETLILEAAATVEGVAASLRIIADELAPGSPADTAALEAALAAKAAAEAALVVAQAQAAAAEEALAVTQANAATAADAAAASLAAASLSLAEAQTQTTALAGQVAGLQEALVAEDADDAGMLAQITALAGQVTALQAALDAANPNPTPVPPIGNPLRLYAGISAQQGGLMSAASVRFTVFADDTLNVVVASGNASLSSLGVLDVPIVAPFAVGAMMPVLVTTFDPALPAADRTVLTTFGWVEAKGVL